MKRTKILYITTRADISGGPTHLNILLQGLEDIEAPVDVYIAAPNNQYFTQLFIQKSISFIPIPFRKLNIFVLIQLLIFVKNTNITVVHSHGRGAGIYSKVLKLFSSFLLVHTYHGIHKEKSIKAILKGSFDRLFRHTIDHSIFLTKEEVKIAKDLNFITTSHSIIHNGVNFEEIRKKIQKLSCEDILQKYNIPKNKIYVCALLRDDPVKGLKELLIKASNYSNENVHFVIAGVDKQDSQNLSKNISIIGTIDGPYEILKIANLFVSHSLSEGMPLSVIEAISTEIPLLLSNIEGHKIFFEKGMATPFSSQIEFNDSLDRLIHKNIQNSIYKDFSHTNMAKSTISTYYN